MTSTITDRRSGTSSAGPEVDRITAAQSKAALKAPVRLATTAPITLSGLQTIDGTMTAEGDRVLVKDMADTTLNGIRIASTGDWLRAPDWDDNSDVVRGTQVYVTDGTVNGSYWFKAVATNPVSVGTSAVTFSASSNHGVDGVDGVAGTDGTDGTSVTWRGAYNGATAYVANDGVSYDGSSYVNILASTGILPTNATYWQLAAAKGDAGATGATGATGAAGSDGAFVGTESIKTNDYTVLSSDRGGILIANKATSITFNLTAVASIGSNFMCMIKNIGVGSLTIDPNGAETIDGNSTLVLTTGQAAFITGNGTVFRSYFVLQSSIGRQSMWLPAGAFIPQITNGPSAGIVELTTTLQPMMSLDFDTTTQEFAVMSWAPPKKWDRSTVTYQVYWTAASGSGTAGFLLEGVAISNDDPLNTAYGTAVAVIDTLLAANDLHISPESAAITIAGSPAEADLVWLRIKRDVATDTLAVDAKFLGIMLFFAVNAGTDA
jgi:hypothetical protein